jgi:hypothetical protein
MALKTVHVFLASLFSRNAKKLIDLHFIINGFIDENQNKYISIRTRKLAIQIC